MDSHSTNDNRDVAFTSEQDYVAEPINSKVSMFSTESVPLTLPEPEDYDDRVGEIQKKDRIDLGPISSSGRIKYPSGLDFERIVNLYSIQATRDRLVQVVHTDLKDEKYRSHKGRQYNATNETVEEPLIGRGKVDYSSFDEDFHDLRQPAVPPPPPQSGLPQERAVSYSLKRHRQKLLGFTGISATRWILTSATGLLMGLTAIFIVSCTDVIQEWRSNYLDSLWQADHRATIFIFIVFASTNLALAMLSAGFCLFLAPEAIGSGVPEVKAYLNGVRVKRFASMRLFFVKIVGTIFSVSSGLTIGPEGPLVHIGAILGATCTKVSSAVLGIFPGKMLFERNERLWSFVTLDLTQFSTDAERRDLVSIGAAAGFASAFGAPIGGLLFAMEEASSFFDHTMFLKTLVATAIAIFCLALHHGELSEYSIISLGSIKAPDDNLFLSRVEELPLYVIVAVAGGVLGGLFCRIFMVLQLFRKQHFTKPRSRLIFRLSEVAFVSILTSTLTYFIPLMAWTCRTVSFDDDLVTDDAVKLFRFHAHQFDCPPGEINELAAIFFGSRDDAIGKILTDPSQFSPWTLFTVGAVFFPLMTLTLGVALPSGVFMPTFLIGSSLGGAAGLMFQKLIDPAISPSTMALLGAAALLAGIQHSTVSLCVILVEGTGQVKILIPVIISVVVARYVASTIHKHGLYETAIELNRYPFLDHQERTALDIFQVKEIMSAPPATLSPRERVADLVRLLKNSDHHGFPVVDPTTLKFLGLARRDQLVALIECGVFEDDIGESLHSIDDDDSSYGDLSTGSVCGYDSEQWTPKPGIGKSPLMNRAYLIKDDRYEYMEKDNQIEKIKKKMSKVKSIKGISNRTLSADAFDTNAWLVGVRQSIASVPLILQEKRKKAGGNSSVVVGYESLPPLKESNSAGFLSGLETSEFSDKKSDDIPECFALVGTNRKGNVYIQWLNPVYRQKFVNVANIMNRATTVVTEFCPVSKVHHLFTILGLRHCIVLGGATGGQVVGLITRINLLKKSIEERSGYEIKYD